jgi:hypothetical protein
MLFKKRGMHNPIPMPAANTPSTLGQGFNNNLAVSSALGVARDESPSHPTVIRPRRLDIVFSASKCISHLRGLKLIDASLQLPWQHSKFIQPAHNA